MFIKLLKKVSFLKKEEKKGVKAALDYFKSRKKLRKLDKWDVEKKAQKYVKVVSKSLGDFKEIDNVFMKTFNSVNEYDIMFEHLMFLEYNVNKGQKKVNDIIELLNRLNACFNNNSEQNKNNIINSNEKTDVLTNKNQEISKINKKKKMKKEEENLE